MPVSTSLVSYSGFYRGKCTLIEEIVLQCAAKCPGASQKEMYKVSETDVKMVFIEALFTHVNFVSHLVSPQTLFHCLTGNYLSSSSGANV